MSKRWSRRRDIWAIRNARGRDDPGGYAAGCGGDFGDSPGYDPFAWVGGKSQAEFESWAFGKVASDYGAAMGAGERFPLAERAGEAVGFASYLADRVVAVYVLPKAARTGVGRALMAAVEGSIQGDGHRDIYLEASASGRVFYRA